jgi:hypothetical protein
MVSRRSREDARGCNDPSGLDRREPLDPLLATTSKTRDTIDSEDACLD